MLIGLPESFISKASTKNVQRTNKDRGMPNNMSSIRLPAKYVKENGVMKLGPEYFQQWKKTDQQLMQGGSSHKRAAASTVPNPAMALPIVTNLADYQALNAAASESTEDSFPLTECTFATLEKMQAGDGGTVSGLLTPKLQTVLEKYEIPMGLMKKLLLLGDYDELQFLIDDSGSMNIRTDALHRQTGLPQTRWQEAQSRLEEMMEILVHVPFRTIKIWFLNRSDRIVIVKEEGQGRHNGRGRRDPEDLLQDVCRRLDVVFAAPPNGSTPYWEKMQESFAEGAGRRVSRYFFSDGAPNGGAAAERRITQLLQNRPHPESNPVTFISCTNEDDQVEWMKDAEEVAPYCSEYDDFEDETREVMRDQGEALPFTRGFYLISQLVAAMNPDDLDAMDENVPFTKTTLDNLLGIRHNTETYRHYFHCFLDAQLRRVVDTDCWGYPKPVDQLKRTFNWSSHYHDFLTQPLAKDIPAVQKFKDQLKGIDSEIIRRKEAAIARGFRIVSTKAPSPCSAF